MPVRLGWGALAFVVGLLLGAVGTFGYASVIGIGSVNVHWGIVVGLLGVACYLVGVRMLAGSRWIALAAAIGVVIPIALFSVKGPGGSVIVQAGALGETWVLVPAVIALLVLAWPSLPARSRAAG